MEPQTINHFAGQPQVTERVRVALEHCWTDSVRFPHSAITGPPGTGKTTIAHLIGRELGVTVHELLAQAVNSIGAMRGALLATAEKEILFLDEAHQLDPDVQVLLYRAMEARILTVNHGDRQTMTLPLANFSVLLATTDFYRLAEPLRDRCALILPFQHYEEDALTRITTNHAKGLQIELDPAIATGIAQRARGTPRLAIRLLNACHRYVRSRGEVQITAERFSRSLELEGLDSLGLDADQQRYLRMLASRDGEPLRLFTISSSLGIHRRTLQEVIEPFLLRSGLIERVQNGRLITARGLEHLGLLSKCQETASR